MTDNFIEDAAKALYEQLHLQHPWDNLIEADKELWRKRARALLPIFAKHMTSDKAVEGQMEEIAQNANCSTANQIEQVDREALEPCPFCGGDASRHTLEDAENFGGDVICCQKCGASSHVEFGRKENLVDTWNTRTTQSQAARKVLQDEKTK